MTTKEFLEQKDHLGIGFHNFELEGLLLEYAILKCEELLSIVAEKASTLPATIYISPGTPHTARLNKDSILNAVNLENFCS